VLAAHARYAIGQSTITLGRAKVKRFTFNFLFWFVKNNKIREQKEKG
jgi:hypothetical protein